MSEMTIGQYNIYDLGYNQLLSKGGTTFGDLSTLAPSSIMGSGFYEISPSQLGSGELGSNLTMVAGLLQSSNFVSGSTGWEISYDGDVEFNSGTFRGSLEAGSIHIPDQTTANSFHTDSTGNSWWGCDVADFESDNDNANAYILKTGVAKLQDVSVVGTISGRSTATIASAIDASGHFADDILDTSSQTILKDFTFGDTDYQGALKAGDITWNTDTGAITGGSGVLVYRGGVVGAKDGDTTFSLDASTGDATFGGTLSAPSGTLGTITAGTIDGCDVYANIFRFKRWTVLYNFSTMDHWFDSTTGVGGKIFSYAANIVALVTGDSEFGEAYIEGGGGGVHIGEDTEWLILFDKSPFLEVVAKLEMSGNGRAQIGMGSRGDNYYIGFYFLHATGEPNAIYCKGGTVYFLSLTNTIDYTLWHKYRILVTPNGDNYNFYWYVDDVLEASKTDLAFCFNVNKNPYFWVENNYSGTGDPDYADLVIGSAIFQEDY